MTPLAGPAVRRDARGPHRLAFLLAAVLAPAAASAADYDFAFPEYFPTGSRPDGVAIGDVDGDGRDDVVLATSMMSDPDNDFRVWIYRNRENGRLALQGRFAWDPGSHIRDVTVALHDLDGDGTDEILLGTASGLSVYVEDGNGGFLHQQHPQAGGCTALSVFHADGDGLVDVMCLSRDVNGRVFHGDGNGWFSRTRAVATAAFGSTDIASGDLDGDGDVDVAVLAYDGFAVLLNDGLGRFTQYASYAQPEAYWPFASLDIGDFDADGRNDVAAAVRANQPESQVALYLQTSSGRFAPPRTSATLDLASDVAARDLDEDGDADLVVVHGFDGIGRYMTDAGQLGQELVTPGLNVSAEGDALALGDVNGDGCPDAAAAYHAGLAVYPGKCIGDGDLREFSLAPATEFATATSPDAVGVGDFDGDGREDLVLTGNMATADGFRTLLYVDGPTRAPTAYAVGGPAMALADFNRDGATDIALDHGGPASLLVSDGSGGMKAVVLNLQPHLIEDCHLIGASDVNLDGALDVVCHQQISGKAMAYPTDGNGAFLEQLVFPTFEQVGQPDAVVRAMAFADLDGDGAEDMLLLSPIEDGIPAIHVFPHDGQSGYGAPTVHAGTRAGAGSDLVLGDFNDDGLEDVAISMGGVSRETLVFLQHPEGGLSPPLVFPAPMGSVVVQGVDVDRNGADDLVATTGNAVQRYMQSAGLIDTTWLDDEIFGAPAIGDLDGDGCNDLAAVLGYAKTLSLRLGICSAGGDTGSGGGGDDDGDDGGDPGRDADSDFDGDGHSDVLWRHATTGANAVWRSADAAARQSLTRIRDVDWRVVGIGDFDADGKDDIAWRHATTGANAIWRSGSHATQLPVARVRNTAWRIQAVADFDGDGRDDLFWRNVENGRNVIWLDGDAARQRAVPAVRNGQWHVAGAADFSGDGVADLLWRNEQTGANTIWLAANPVGQDNIADTTDAGWRVAAASDFDGDGRADILWRNRDRGKAELWLGGRATSRQPLRDVAAGWDVAATGDYDADGFLDILWRHSSSGRNVLWLFGDPAMQLPVADVADTRWQVVP